MLDEEKLFYINHLGAFLMILGGLFKNIFLLLFVFLPACAVSFTPLYHCAYSSAANRYLSVVLLFCKEVVKLQ